MDVERIDRIPDSFPGRTAGRVGGAAPDYEPLLPRWTRHGGLLLMVFAVAMLPAATFLRFDTYQRVRATLVDHGPDRVLILSGGVPAQAMPATGPQLRFIAEGDRNRVYPLQLERATELDTGSGALHGATASATTAFVVSFADAAPARTIPVLPLDGVLVVPAGRLSLWQHLGQWL